MKQSEINKLSLEESKDQLNKCKSDYSDLKLLHAVTPLENPMRIRELRRTIARLSTAISNKKDKSTG